MNEYNKFLSNFTGEQKTAKFDLTDFGLANGKMFASNGHVLCCIDQNLCDLSEVSTTPKPNINTIYETAKMLDEPVWWKVADIYPEPDEVKALTPKRRECSECNGGGEVECNYDHKHDCPDCDGWGFVNEPAIRSVNFNDTYFQWQYFQLVLEAANKFGNGEFQQLTISGESQQLFQIDGIEIFVMPQRDSVSKFVPLTAKAAQTV
jgi:hypothetical protein